jgi:uncharacterized damage-inducible protein DinB
LVAVVLSHQPFWQALQKFLQFKIVQNHDFGVGRFLTLQQHLSGLGRSSCGYTVFGVFMTEKSFYDYLVRSRRGLFTFVRSMPDEAISRDVIPGKRFHSIKDLVLHIPIIEDSWLHEDILKDQPVWDGFPDDVEKAYHATDKLERMLEYWLAVEKSTLSYLEKLEPSTLDTLVTLNQQDGTSVFSVEEILWHVMQHEVRHTAQIMLLARQMGFEPPQLDLNVYVARFTPKAEVPQESAQDAPNSARV